MYINLKNINLIENGLKYNWGCGNDRMDGYIGVDIDPVKDCDIICDIDSARDLPKGNVKEIYSKHFIEHIEYWEAEKLFKVWVLMISKDGFVTITFPDLRKIDRNINEKVALNFAFAETGKGYDVHNSYWTAYLMEKFLLNAGFKKVINTEVPNKNLRDNQSWNTTLIAYR